MHSTLDEFLRVTSELREFVDSIKPVYATLAGHASTEIGASLNIRRRLDYTAFIVTLYAAFERFVEDLAWSHAEIESSRKRYTELSRSLRRKHLRDSATLLGTHLGEGRYAEVDAASVVENLHCCLSGQKAYRLNRHAIIRHESNLRGAEVDRIFASMGVEGINALARRAEPMIELFRQVQGREAGDEIPESQIDLRMQEFVESRNQVTHSGGNLREIISPEDMHDRIAFVEAYSRSLFHVLAGAYLEEYYVQSATATALGDPIEGPIKSRTVIVIRKPACRVYVGQAIFGIRDGQVDRWGEVVEIRVENNPVNSIEVNSTVAEVGLRADFKLTKGTRLYVLEKKDEVVWG